VPPPITRSFKSRAETLAAIRKQLDNTPEQDRPFQRFFTLEHLYNQYRSSEEDLKKVLNEHREALAGLLGLFNPAGSVKNVLADGTVLQVDIRSVGWDRSRAWLSVLVAYPYGLLDQEVKDIEDFAGDQGNVVRADWFVAAASQDPLLPLLAGGSDAAAGKSPDAVPSVRTVQQRYRKELGAGEAALELGLPDKAKLQDGLRRAMQEDDALEGLLNKHGLGPLTQGGAVSREHWAARDGLRTGFHEVAESLGLVPRTWSD
jgi:hypothetical protein